MPHFTKEEVAKHNTADDCWIIVHNKVFDVTKFLSEHPGGKKVILKKAGQDATKQFEMFHAASVLKQYGPKLYVGDVGTGASQAIVQSNNTTEIPRTIKNVIYGEPAWLAGWNSPYYNDSHHKWRAAVRAFVDKEIIPYCAQWDEAYELPSDLLKKCYDAGWLPAIVGPPWPTELVGSNIAGGIKPEEFDAFHEMILLDEMARSGSAGVNWGLCAGLNIGLPPVLHFGNPAMRKKVAGPCMRGEKVICLAITEPYAGSDVANLKTTAIKTDDGNHYIVNGEKKWITNGVFADFFTVAVRTGGAGMGGISLLLLEKGMPGITTRKMKCSGAWCSGTTYITFEDVKVPVENLIGTENRGFKCIMFNFNHERWTTATQAIRMARVCLEESFKYAFKRKTFGKPLVGHAVIREKIANMARKVESIQNWLENITYQMTTMSIKEQRTKLGGPIALIKAHASQVFEYCAREACQIFGGLSYTRGGQAEKVERLYREVRAYAIPAGSEEIMLDLSIRQAIKQAPKL